MKKTEILDKECGKKKIVRYKWEKKENMITSYLIPSFFK